MLLLEFLHNHVNFNLYKKWILIVSVGILPLLKTANASLEEFNEETVKARINTSFLDWSKRPERLTELVNERFEYVINRATDWGLYPGNDSNGFDYCVMGVPDPLLVHNIILQNPDQRAWFFIDIGSGNGSWSRTLMNYLVRQFANELAQDSKAFRILSLTGDSHKTDIEELPAYTSKIILPGSEQLLSDLEAPGCIIYECFLFQIECLIEKLQPIQSHVDAIFSFATLRHCADGLGTYAQAFDLLKDGGFLITDSNINGLLNGKRYDLSIMLPQLEIPCLIYNDTIEGVMAQKIKSKGISRLTYGDLIETPGLLDTHSTITSPCKVNYVGDLESQEMQELTVEDAYIPGLLGRRRDLDNIRLNYNEEGHTIFENIFYGAVLGIQKYLNDTKNTNNEFGISRYLSKSFLQENERLRRRFPHRSHEIDDDNFPTPTVRYN